MTCAIVTGIMPPIECKVEVFDNVGGFHSDGIRVYRFELPPARAQQILAAAPPWSSTWRQRCADDVLYQDVVSACGMVPIASDLKGAIDISFDVSVLDRIVVDGVMISASRFHAIVVLPKSGELIYIYYKL